MSDNLSAFIESRCKDLVEDIVVLGGTSALEKYLPEPFASAPELLKYLEIAIRIITDEYPEEQWNDYKVDKMEAVIKKARGE